MMVEQYNAFNPIDTHEGQRRVHARREHRRSGRVTIAHYAYQKSLAGKESPVIDGFTGEQRFFLGWAQVWARKYRDDELRRRLITDPHSPSEYRANGIVANMPEFQPRSK